MGSECCAGRSHRSDSTYTKSVLQDSYRQSVFSSLENSFAPTPCNEPASEEDEVKVRIRLAVKNIVLDIPIRAVEVEEDWVSPVSCKGAEVAVELARKLRQNWTQVAFRTYVKEVAIEEGMIRKLLDNLKSRNQSLRRSSVYVLSHIVVPSQWELTYSFIQEGGILHLTSLLQEDDSEGLFAAVCGIINIVYASGKAGARQVLDTTIPLLISRIGGMRIAKYVKAALHSLEELLKRDHVVAHQLKSHGLPETLSSLSTSLSSGQIQADSTLQLTALQQQVASLQTSISNNSNLMLIRLTEESRPGRVTFKEIGRF